MDVSLWFSFSCLVSHSRLSFYHWFSFFSFWNIILFLSLWFLFVIFDPISFICLFSPFFIRSCVLALSFLLYPFPLFFWCPNDILMDTGHKAGKSSTPAKYRRPAKKKEECDRANYRVVSFVKITGYIDSLFTHPLSLSPYNHFIIVPFYKHLIPTSSPFLFFIRFVKPGHDC